MATNRYNIDDNIYIVDSLQDEDVPALVKYANNPKICASTLTIPYPYTMKDGEDFIEKIKSSSSSLKQTFGIHLQANDELIGVCGIFRPVQGARRAEIGYWLGEPYWHRGWMPKVVKKVIEIAKSEWDNLVRIDGETFTWNKASGRVLEKCGFQFEGLLRKYVYKDGQDIDVNLYALVFD